MNKVMYQHEKIVGVGRVEEFYDRVDRIKYGDTESVEAIRKDFGDAAAKLAQDILDAFWGKYVGTILKL